MASTYVNDLRLNEMATGDASGTWGTITNTNLELIGEALGYATQDCFTSDADATTTVADGATDPARAMYFKVTSSATLTATRTLTIAPNTVSRLQFIENATTGSQSINISQGSGANVTIPTGDTKAVYLDGAGSGAAVTDAFASLSVVDLKVQDDLTVTDDMTVGGTLGVTGVSSFADGTNSAPSLTFTSDTNTGIYRGGTDILKFVTAGTDRVTILANGDTGIGVSPSTTLHVKSANPNFRLETTQAVASGGTVYNTLRDSTGSDVFLNGFAGLANCYQFATIFTNGFMRFLTGNQVEAMRIDSSGRMLLGTTTEGDATADDLTVATTGHTGITIRSGTTHEGSLFYSDGTSGDDEYRGFVQYLHSANALRFGTNAVERMRIDSSGRTGIGITDNFRGFLNVFNGDDFNTATNGNCDNIYLVSDATSGDNVYGASIAFSRVQYPDRRGAAIASVQTGSDEDNVGLAFFTHPSTTSGDPIVEAMRIDSSGNVGIGTSSPEQKVHIEGISLTVNNSNADSSIGFQNSTSGATWRMGRDYSNSEALSFAYKSNDYPSLTSDSKVVIDTSGNVGIGTASPSQALTINDGSITSNVTHTFNLFGATGTGGSSAYVTYSFVGDPNTGMYSGTADTLKFATGGTERMRIDANGHVTMPYQSAFQAQPSINQLNIANGVTIVFGTERFDQNGDFSSSIFTAPITGKYQFNATIRADQIDRDANWVRVELATSNLSYFPAIFDPGVLSSDPDHWFFSFSYLADMDAGDTAQVKWGQSAGADTADIDTQSQFSGYLVA